jgi:hypothetical protein
MADEKHNHTEAETPTASTQAGEHRGKAKSPNQKGSSSPNTGFSSADPPRAPSGLSTGLQPGGLVPGGGPGASAGSIGTGGAQTDNRDSGSLKRDGK